MEKFRYMGRAVILHLNTRKEGPEDAQELALDLKLKTIADQLVMRFFDADLAGFVFLSNGAVRNSMMGPVTYSHELESYRLDMVDSSFFGVRVKKFSLEPMDRFKVAMTFSISLKPSGDEVARIAEFLQDEIELSLAPSDNELDFGDSTGVRTVHVESAADDELLYTARDLVANHRRASVSLVQRHLRIGYNRAARLIEALEVLGIVSKADENGNRTVLVEEGASA